MNNQDTNRKIFFQEFLKHPLQIGWILPSSRYLERRIVTAAAVGSANVVVELGSGTGGTTRALLKAMPKHARLLSIEINPHFHDVLFRIKDNRLIPHLGSAYELQEILSVYRLDAPNAVISGIPFSTMSRDSGSHIIEMISSMLAPNGRFVAYQISNRVAALCRPFLGNERTEFEILNLPPTRIFQWQKNGKIIKTDEKRRRNGSS